MDGLILVSRSKSTSLDEVITPSRTSATDQLDISVAKANSSPNIQVDQEIDIQTLDDVYKVLGSKPSIEVLFKVLKWLQEKDNDYRWKIPSPKTARVTNLLVSNALPDHWMSLRSEETPTHRKTRKLLLGYLSSLPGISALLNRLQSLMMRQKNEPQQRDAKVKARLSAIENAKALDDVIDVLQRILEKQGIVSKLWTDFEAADIKPLQRGLLQKELVNFLSGSRVLSISAEAFAMIDELSSEVGSRGWIGNGPQYTSWLATGIRNLMLKKEESSKEGLHDVFTFFTRALSLGHADQIIKGIFWNPSNADTEGISVPYRFLGTMDPHLQKIVLYSLMRVMSEETASRMSAEDTPKIGAQATSAIAGFLSTLIREKPHLRGFLTDWVTDDFGGSDEVNECVRRAAILLVSQHGESVQGLFKTLLNLFGDSLYIKHTPIFNQEVLTKSLLLTAGYVSRANVAFLKLIAQSSQYINAISSRIAASSPRAKFLGMVVGNAITLKVSPQEKKMIFGGDELNGEEGQKYSKLVEIQDGIGSARDVQSFFKPPRARKKVRNTLATPKRGEKEISSASKIIAIEEVNESSGSDDDDLPIHEKPDSDEDDEDSDPELVQRNKSTAPVYIRDLIKGLRDTENYDRHRLALTTASSLIRRKAHFGKEVIDHIEELATQITGLSDKYSMDDFPKLRIQAMVAIFIAQPLEMGRWFSRTYFNGDYSVAQRASILTTLTMGARELAGFKKEDGDLTGANSVPKNPFPTKRLSDKMHKLWATEAAPVNSLTQSLQRLMIKPMAAEAADQLAGPKVLQVRTFSSRMEVEKRRKKPIANELAKIVADGVFFPLTARRQNHLQAYGARSAHMSPFLLSHFLKTLALLLHASGPSTLSLPQMTREFWALLLSLRTMASEDVLILEALLFSFMTLLDVNEDKRRIAEDFSNELLETQAWVKKAFDGMKGGSVEGERIRMLAAGILVGTGEVVEKYQQLMLGDLINYS